MPGWDATAVGLYSLQIAVLVAVAAVAGRVARASSAVVRLAYWRFVVAAALLLPLVPEMVGPESLPSFVAGTVAGVGTALAITVEAPGSTRIPVLWILVGGAILRAGWLALGLVRLRQLRRDSAPLPPDPDLEALRRRLAPRAELRRHTGLDQPATFGLWRPVVILPPAVAGLPADARQAILCHELLHVARRDWLWLWLEEAVRTAFWFHPAMRWALGRVRLGREQTIDATVVAETGVRRAYMDALVQFAAGRGLPAPAMPFVRRRHVAQRISSLLEEDTMSRTRLLVTGAVLFSTVVGVGWGVTAAVPQVRSQVQEVGTAGVVPTGVPPGTVYRVDPEYPQEAARFEVAAEVVVNATVNRSGLVVDTRSSSWAIQIRRSDLLAGPTAAEEVRLSRLFIEAARDAARQWRFQARDEDWTGIVSFSFSPPPPAGQAAAVSAGSARPGEIVPSPPPPPPAPTAGPLRPLRVGDSGVRPPRKLVNVSPVYPPAARDAKVQGVVILETVIGVDGTVARTGVVRSIPLLDQAAMDAVRQWRFEPTLLNGVPVEVEMVVTINFTLTP
jgi:TonB family protein